MSEALNPKPVNEWTPMALAAKSGDAEAVRRLLESGEPADPPAHPSGITPMNVAVAKGHVAVVELLLTAGGSVNTRFVIRSANDGEETDGRLLSIAACNGHVELVELLLRHGADPNASEHPGGNALLVAVREKKYNMSTKLAVVRALLRGGSAPDRRGLDGYSALHTAAARGDAEVIALLAEHGASLLLRNDDGHSALTIAADGEWDAAVDALLAAGAEPDASVSMRGMSFLYKRACVQRDASEARLREERAKVASFVYAIPHIVASAGSLHRERILGAPGGDPRVHQ
jgi:ankyrin repeat protein